MSKSKLNILFDATVLVDGYMDCHARTGMYFVAENLLDEMLCRDDINVVLMTFPSKSAGLYKIKPQNATILDDESFLSRIVFSLLYGIKRRRREVFSLTPLRKALSLIELILENGYETYYSKFIFRRYKKWINSNEVVYFSPTTDAPKYLYHEQKVKKFIVLLDAIPFKLKGYEKQRNNRWICYFLNKDFYYFAISESTKKDFCEIYPSINPEHIQVIYLAAKKTFCPQMEEKKKELTKSKYGIPLEKRYVFSLCTLEPRKNLIRAVKSFIRFAEKNSVGDMIFALGGPAWKDFEKQLENDADISGLYSKYVVWIGYVDDDDLPVLYSNAEWFVYTSQYEGFGLPPLEAMQCGCPVITSNNSSLPEVVGDAGIMIDWDSEDQHIKAYEEYYFDEQLRKDNAQKGLQRSKSFSWRKAIDEMLRRMSNE